MRELSDELGPKANRLGFWSGVGIFVFALVVLSVNLGASRELTHHETLFAQPAREMLQSGDWLVPTYAGETSLHKPPIMHLSIALSTWLTGAESRWAVRLPSVLAGALTCVLVGAIGAAAAGRAVGLLAGLIYACSFALLMQARLAEADMLLALGVAFAYWLIEKGSRVHHEEVHPESEKRDGALSSGESIWRRRGIIYVFYLTLGLLFLTKWIPGPAFVATGALLFATLLYLRGDRSQPLWHAAISPIGWLILLAIVGGWWLAAQQIEPDLWQYWSYHNLRRFSGTMGDMEGTEPTPYYLYTALALLLPWSPFLLLAAGRHLPASQQILIGVALLLAGALAGLDLAIGYSSSAKVGCVLFLLVGVAVGLKIRKRQQLLLWCWFIAGTALLTASSWKHKHYIIPILPPVAIASAAGLRQMMLSPPAWLNWRWTLPAVAFAAIASAITGVILAPDFALPTILLALTVGCGLCLAILFQTRRWGNAYAASLLLTTAISAWVVFIFIMPRIDSYAEQADFGRSIRQRAQQTGQPVLYYRLPEHHLMYFGPQPPVLLADKQSLRAKLADSPTSTIVFLPRSLMNDLTPLDKVKTIGSTTRVRTIPVSGIGHVTDYIIAVEVEVEEKNTPSESD